MAIQERIYTADDLWDLSHRAENDDKRFELSAGRLIEMVLAGGEHGGVAYEFGWVIGSFVRERRLGYMTASETGFVLHRNPNGRDTVRAPDGGFIMRERLPDGLPRGYIPLAPDLAIEVVSPTDKAEEIRAKIEDYIRFGVRLFVFVYPASRRADVYVKGEMHTLAEDDTLDFGEVLPGLTVQFRDLLDIDL